MEPVPPPAGTDLPPSTDPLAVAPDQGIGYAYLTDDSSLVLEPIPGGRDYQPAYRDDYRLTQTGPPA